MPDINGIPYVESDDLVSAYPSVSQSLAQEVSDQLAAKLPYSYGTATPSTSVDGFLWYDENDTPPTPKFWDGAAFQALGGGLVLINKQTFTSVSNISINNVFTSAYDNYRVLIKAESSNTSVAQLRLRASSIDNTANQYNYQTLRRSATTSSGTSAVSTSWQIGVDSTTSYSLQMDLFSPAVAERTRFLAMSHRRGNTIEMAGGEHDNSSYTADGFTYIDDSGTVSGAIWVYGYATS